MKFFLKYILMEHEVYQVTGNSGRFWLYAADSIACIVLGGLGFLFSSEIFQILPKEEYKLAAKLILLAVMTVGGIYVFGKKLIGRMIYRKGKLAKTGPKGHKSFGLSDGAFKVIQSDRHTYQYVINRIWYEIILGAAALVLYTIGSNAAGGVSSFIANLYIPAAAIVLIYHGTSRLLKHKRARNLFLNRQLDQL